MYACALHRSGALLLPFTEAPTAWLDALGSGEHDADHPPPPPPPPPPAGACDDDDDSGGADFGAADWDKPNTLPPPCSYPYPYPYPSHSNTLAPLTRPPYFSNTLAQTLTLTPTLTPTLALALTPTLALALALATDPDH